MAPIIMTNKMIINIYIYILMIPKIVSELHGPHVPWTKSAQQRRKNPTDSTGMVPAKNPPKVKLENFYNFKVSELG